MKERKEKNSGRDAITKSITSIKHFSLPFIISSSLLFPPLIYISFFHPFFSLQFAAPIFSSPFLSLSPLPPSLSPLPLSLSEQHNTCPSRQVHGFHQEYFISTTRRHARLVPPATSTASRQTIKRCASGPSLYPVLLLSLDS